MKRQTMNGTPIGDEELGALARALLQQTDNTAPLANVISEAWGTLDHGALSEKPEPREYLLHLPPSFEPLHPGGGFAPMGVGAVLTSEGGVGKTMVLLQLAVSVITGKDWLGFRVDEKQRGRRVAMLLGEETEDEVHRRLYVIAEHLQLTEAERRLVERRLVRLPLAGKACSLMTVDKAGNPSATAAMRELLDRLHEQPSEPWALVGIDPIARLLPAAEKDNELATFAVQLLEQLADTPGRPLATGAHHSSKAARVVGRVDSRGVTGLPDATRLALSLKALDDSTVELARPKGNYSVPIPGGSLRLLRVPGTGLLRLPTQEDQVAAATGLELAKEKLIAEVVEVVREHPGIGPKSAISRLMGKRNYVVGAAIDEAHRRGLIVETKRSNGQGKGFTVSTPGTKAT